MFTYHNEEKPLESLRRQFACTPNVLKTVELGSAYDELIIGLEDPAMLGVIDFRHFRCKWLFYRKASIFEPDYSVSTVRENVLSVAIEHSGSKQTLHGWILCTDAGDAFKKMNKLGFLAGDMADFS